MDTPTTAKKTLKNSSSNKSLTPCRRIGLGRPSSGSLKKLVQVRTINTPSHNSSQVDNQSNLSSIPLNKTKEMSACGLSLKVTFNPDCVENKGTTRIRRCLTQDLKTSQFLQSGKRTCNENEKEDGIVSYELRAKCGSFEEESNTNNKFKKLKSNPQLTETNNGTEIINENINTLVCKNNSTKTLANINEKTEQITEEVIIQLGMSLLEKKKKLEQHKVQDTYAKKHNLEELRMQTAKWRAGGQEALRYCVKLAKQAGYPVTIQQLMIQHGFPQILMGYNPDDDEFD